MVQRIYICYSDNDMTPQEVQTFHQLRDRLQQDGHEVLANADLSAERNATSFLEDQLPRCQWFLLFQTPAALQAPLARVIAKTTRVLIEQGRLHRRLRFIATTDEFQAVPAEWSGVPAIDGTSDPSRAIEKLLLIVSEERAMVESTSTSPLAIRTPVAVEKSITTSPPARKITPYAVSSSYDRPSAPPSRWYRLKHAYQNMGNTRKSLILVAIVLLILTIPGMMLGSFFLNRPAPAASKPAPSTFGSVYFSSSGLLSTDTTSGIVDGLNVQLQDLKPPATGNSYYSWLLPDKSQLSEPALMVGKFTVKDGKGQFTYKSPKRNNLIAITSRFLVTEEPSTPAPVGPNPDKNTWRYYSELPQVPNPDDPNHFSNLDHLRHLLSGESSMEKNMLKGGLSIWFLQNIRKIFEWSSAARGANVPQDPDLMHRHFVRILDYLDGADLVKMDVPKDTPLLVDEKIASIPLLTLDEDPMHAGYINKIELHLLELSNSPSTTKEQQKLAGQINAELNKIKVLLEQIREDAKKLVIMNNTKLLASATTPILDDLLNLSTEALAGRMIYSTGNRQGGAIWAFDQTQRLATFTVRLSQ